ncbi:cys-Gly metallodipeptidase DUG1-like [Octopus sinensis]|uniref:Cys-Gly metallodipeptidase DUG1-like n=1 Tax=Octopus sinensis TaxID=2607531 RepID=A0A6P7TQF0_9MOLL|nr:cys-Gly metallodipeptidase DUG1-like [Octopus sinensis]
MHRMRYPSLSFHGIEGAFHEAGCKTVIPACVKGKFSIRTVPNMDNHDVINKVEKYCQQVHSALNSSTEMTFVASVVYGVEPDLTREGGSIPIVFDIERATRASVVLLPCGRGDDGAHSQNEKLDLSNYINGTKLFAAYLTELAN